MNRLEFAVPLFGYCYLIIALLCSGFSYAVECCFILRFTKVNTKVKFYLFYLLEFLILQYAANKLLLLDWIYVLSAFAMIVLFVKFILKQPIALSSIVSLLVLLTKQLVLGILAPFFYLVVRYHISIQQYQVLQILSLLVSTMVTAAIYYYIVRKVDLKEIEMNRYLVMILAPFVLMMVFFKLTEETGYWETVVSIDNESNQGSMVFNITFMQECQILLLSIAAFICIFAALYAFQKMQELFKEEKRKAVWEQQLYAQKNYAEEVKLRLKQTKSVRHDFKNHLTIVNGLLEKNKIAEAKDYLNKLNTITEHLSFPCDTGNLSIDALLCNKLGIAKQAEIKIECDIVIPKGKEIEDFDLGIIFANAVDNATAACQLVEIEKRFIKIKSRIKGDFFMIEVMNSCNPLKKNPGGTGIGIPNIEEIAKKYKGTISTEMGVNYFQLNVLLIISRHQEDHSEHFA